MNSIFLFFCEVTRFPRKKRQNKWLCRFLGKGREKVARETAHWLKREWVKSLKVHSTHFTFVTESRLMLFSNTRWLKSNNKLKFLKEKRKQLETWLWKWNASNSFLVPPSYYVCGTLVTVKIFDFRFLADLCVLGHGE